MTSISPRAKLATLAVVVLVGFAMGTGASSTGATFRSTVEFSASAGAAANFATEEPTATQSASMTESLRPSGPSEVAPRPEASAGPAARVAVAATTVHRAGADVGDAGRPAERAGPSNS